MWKILNNTSLDDMAKKYNYTAHKVKSIADLKQLEDAIRKYGNYSKTDYRRAISEAESSAMPSRLQRRLRNNIFPLIMAPGSKSQDDCKKANNDILKNEEDAKFFAQTFKASDFTLKEGFIEINGWKLKTKRVHTVHPSWLEGIDHVFHIAKETNKGKQFHFVPYTDLSVLLNAIQDKVNQQQECKIIAAYNVFKESLPSEIDHYINKRLIDNAPKHQGASVLYLYRKLIAYKLLNQETSFEDFDNSLDKSTIRIKLDKLSIYDGYIEFNPKHIDFIEDLSWESFKDWMIDCRCSMFFRRWDSEIKEIFENQLSSYLNQRVSGQLIRINTYMSRQSFIDSFCTAVMHPFWTQISSSNKFISQRKYLFIPFSYLMNEENDGASILSYLNERELSEALCSERSDLGKSLDSVITKQLKDYQCEGFEQKLKEILCSETYFQLREITQYYRNREEIRGWYDNSSQFLRIFRFYENCAHYSDDDYYNGSWGKSTEYHVSHLVIDMKCHQIILSPTNFKYSRYRFIVASDSSLEVAALVILKYFASDIQNKRQYFTLPKIFEHFGIYSLYKY